uniref:Uncharacterized protein n=1 Tax=mine drainage metagenome TaxID=410659 RepID=E6QNX3_9ZZZZ
MRAALREMIKLAQGLQLTVTRRNRIKQASSQLQCTEAALPNGGEVQAFPLREKHLIQIISQIVGYQRQRACITAKIRVDVQRGVAITFQNFPCIAIHPRCFWRNSDILIQQSAKWLAFRLPSNHPLGRQFNRINGRSETVSFCVEQDPMGIVHGHFPMMRTLSSTSNFLKRVRGRISSSVMELLTQFTTSRYGKGVRSRSVSWFPPQLSSVNCGTLVRSNSMSWFSPQ